MSNKLKTLLIGGTIFLGCAFGACKVDDVANQNKDNKTPITANETIEEKVEDYFPSAVGNFWEYEYERDGKKVNTRLEILGIVNLTENRKFFVDSKDEEVLDTLRYYLTEDKKTELRNYEDPTLILALMTSLHLFSESGSEIFWTEEVGEELYFLNVNNQSLMLGSGELSGKSGYLPLFKLPMQLTNERLGKEDFLHIVDHDEVKIGNKEFDCIKVTIGGGEIDDDAYTHYYFAKDVGLVKYSTEDFGEKAEFYLKNYDLKGKGK